MAQTMASKSFADRIQWNERVKPGLIVLAIAAVAYLIGAYFMGPRMAAAQPTHLPATFVAMPLGSVMLTHADGTAALLPVRLGDTSIHRGNGFAGVGEQAMDGKVLLYTLTRETTSRTTYATATWRAPTEFAAIDAAGTVVSITPVAAGAERASIGERHQWLLVAKAGTLSRFGVEVGSTIDPASVRRF
jgi:hypothetical protein